MTISNGSPIQIGVLRSSYNQAKSRTMTISNGSPIQIAVLRSSYNQAKAPISLGCDAFAMGLRIDSPNRRELSQNVRMVSQSPCMHRELVANGSPKF